MDSLQWLIVGLSVYTIGVVVQAVRSWLEMRWIAQRERQLQLSMRRLALMDREDARRVAEQAFRERQGLDARLRRVTIRRALTWGLWP